MENDFKQKGHCGAYTITYKKSGKIYVGSSNNMHRRMTAHIWQLKNKQHKNIHLQRAYNNDPEIEFYFIITEDRETAYQREQDLIDYWYEKGTLFNIATNARDAGANVSEETRKRLSVALKGMKRTLETREKIRQAKIGIKRPPHVGEISRRLKLGVKLSEEHKAKLRASHVGRKMPPRTPEWTEKIRIAKLGFRHSAESREKIKKGIKTRRAVCVDGVVYPSILDAAKAFNLDHKTIRTRIKLKRPGWSYL